MYVTENSMGLCIVLEHTGDIAKCLSAFHKFNSEENVNHSYIPNRVLSELEEEIAQ